MWKAAPQRLHVPAPVLDAKASGSIDRGIRKSFVNAPSGKDVGCPNVIDEQIVPVKSGIGARFLNHEERFCESVRRRSSGVTIEVGFIKQVDPLWMPNPLGRGIRRSRDRMGRSDPMWALRMV